MEVVAALGVLGIAILMVTQLGVQSLQGRARAQARQEALEVAANLLETARATPWDALTPEWATAHQLPESLAERLWEGKLTVDVRPEKDAPRTKRITVEITWQQPDGHPGSLQLVGVFTARAAPAAEVKP